MTSLNIAFATAPPARRSLLGRLADLVDRAVQQMVLVFFYYIPVAFARLNPFQRKSDVRQVHAGASRFDNGRYAIYVLWQPGGTIPWYVRDLLDALKARQVNTIAVLNHEPSPGQLDILEGLCATIMVRGNKGADFGAYKDAVVSLTRDNDSVSRLLLLNDSVYVLRTRLDKLLTELLSDDYPVVAAYECWERLYHFQSFCLGLSGSVLYDRRVREFWERYLPIAIRRWRIDHGEVALSAALRSAASRYKVIYDLNELLALLTAEENWAGILKYREFVPRPVRHLLPADEVLSILQQARPAEREILLRRLRENLSDLLMLRAQAHTGAFFFAKFLGSPFLKRDLVYRELFTVYEVERMLGELGWNEHREAITDEIRQKGTAAHLKGMMRRRYRLRLI